MSKKTERKKQSGKSMSRETEMHKKRDMILFVLIVVLLIAGVAVFLWNLSGAGKEPCDTIAFRVGAEEVYMDEVNLCILQNVVDLGIGEKALNTTAEDGSSADSYYKNEILQLIMDYKVEAQVAKKQGIALTKKEKETVSKDVTEYLGQIDGRILSNLGIKKDRVIEIYQERYLAHKLEQTVTDDVDVEDQRYCTIYMLLFPKVQVDEEGNYLTEEDGQTPLMLSDEEIAKQKQNAEEAYRRLQDGEDITELAKEYGVEKVSGEQSNMEESFGDAFTDEIKKLKEGDVSPVIDISSCYAILKMVKENNEELAAQVMDRYRSDKEKDALKEKRTAWYDDEGITEASFVGNAWKNLSLYDFAKYVEE